MTADEYLTQELCNKYLLSFDNIQLWEKKKG